LQLIFNTSERMDVNKRMVARRKGHIGEEKLKIIDAGQGYTWASRRKIM